jgi:hypothetical protein
MRRSCRAGGRRAKGHPYHISWGRAGGSARWRMPRAGQRGDSGHARRDRWCSGPRRPPHLALRPAVKAVDPGSVAKGGSAAVRSREARGVAAAQQWACDRRVAPALEEPASRGALRTSSMVAGLSGRRRRADRGGACTTRGRGAPAQIEPRSVEIATVVVAERRGRRAPPRWRRGECGCDGVALSLATSRRREAARRAGDDRCTWAPAPLQVGSWVTKEVCPRARRAFAGAARFDAAVEKSVS